VDHQIQLKLFFAKCLKPNYDFQLAKLKKCQLKKIKDAMAYGKDYEGDEN
jgi:hypothetical protein